MKLTVLLILSLLGLLASRDAQAFYNPSTGRWLSRDPIGEKGGRNLYGFVRNTSVTAIDALGLSYMPYPFPHDIPDTPPQYPPPTPFPQKFLKKYDCSCCGAKEIADGKTELIDRFKQAKSNLDTRGLQPNADAEKAGEAPCDTSNGAILQFMNPTPRCWICYMDRRFDNSWISVWDENFIHCYTMNNQGIKDELILDWFDSVYHGTTGIYPDVNKYYKRYPTPTKQYLNTPVYADCSSSRTWSADYSKFDFMFDPTRREPPANR